MSNLHVPYRFGSQLLLILLGLITAVRPLSAAEIGALRFEEKQYTICRVDPAREQLRLFWRDAAGRPFKSFEALNTALAARREKLVFAMNAGMYHGDFSPVGLYVENRQELRPLNLDPGEGNFFLKPNGVFAITESGAHVLEASRYPTIRERVVLATQSGPMLVIDGRIHPAFRANSESHLFRNGVGVVSAHQTVFAISEEPVNFHTFARLFRDGLRCRNALFLDGTICSLHSPQLKRSDKKMDLGTIIGLTAPADE